MSKDKETRELPYDEQYTAHVELYKEYEQSGFNDDTQSEYDCMVKFLDSKYSGLSDEELELLEDMFIDWWESGFSGYWAEIEEAQDAEGTFKNILQNNYKVRVYDAEDGDELGFITKKGLLNYKVHAQELDYPTDEYDAVSADAIFQMIILGEVTYG